MVAVGAFVVCVVAAVAVVVALAAVPAVAAVVAVVAGEGEVAAPGEAGELDEDRLPAVAPGVELTAAALAPVDPGISLDTTSPRTAAAPAAATATSLEMRRTLVVAWSRRAAAIRRMRWFCSRAPTAPGSRAGGVLMEPCHHANLASVAQFAKSRL